MPPATSPHVDYLSLYTANDHVVLLPDKLKAGGQVLQCVCVYLSSVCACVCHCVCVCACVRVLNNFKIN